MNVHEKGSILNHILYTRWTGCIVVRECIMYGAEEARGGRGEPPRAGLERSFCVMADRRTSMNYRQRNVSGAGRREYYVYGSAVRQAEARPQRRTAVPPQRRMQVRPERTRRTSSQVRRNRNRAMSISPAYAVFLSAAAVFAVIVCVLYLHLQSEVVNRSENITSLQQQLADMKEVNTTEYNAALDSVNLEEVRTRAMEELGLVYEAEGTVIEYNSPTSDYVRQYYDIPEDGVLAQSKGVSD